ncbi:MAG: hypothetical protein WCL51_12805 [Bacteroidota bacterium]|jgi:hypothetical protein
MQNYINQLIEDLGNAKSLAPESPVLSEVYEEFEEQMLEIENTPDTTSYKLMGLSFEQFPPSEKLNESQIEELVIAITDTLDAYSICADFPKRMPKINRYELLRDIFKEDIQYMPGFTHHYDFCTGNCEDCKIGEYCDTKDEIIGKDTIDEKDVI